MKRTLYRLARHTIAKPTAKKGFSADLDRDLTPEGIELAKEKAKLCGVDYDRVFAGNSVRLVRTAEILSAGNGVDLLPELTYHDTDTPEGKVLIDVYKQLGDVALIQYAARPTTHLILEHQIAAGDRILERTADIRRKANGRVLVVNHGIYMSALAMHLVQGNASAIQQIMLTMIDKCGMIDISYEDGTFAGMKIH